MDQAGEEQQILVALRRIIRAVEGHSRQLAQRFGLTAPQILVLYELQRNEGLATGELARRVHLAQPTVSEILDRLEQLSLVTRRRSADDRRRVECFVTAKGVELLSRNPSLLQESVVAELRKLPEWERSFLLAALQKLAAMMHAEDVDAAPLLTAGPAAGPAEKVVEFLEPEEG